MINVRHRFHGQGGIKRVYTNGRTVRSPHISLKYAMRDGGRPYRAAVVVSRKVHKSAVARNRMRRRTYEIIRQADSSLLEGKDLVFTVFSNQVAEMDAAKLRSTIETLLRKAAESPSRSPKTPVRHGIVNKRQK